MKVQRWYLYVKKTRFPYIVRDYCREIVSTRIENMWCNQFGLHIVFKAYYRTETKLQAIQYLLQELKKWVNEMAQKTGL